MTAIPAEENLVCPVCRAVQKPSETCRRCRCDLRLVLCVQGAARDARRQALLHLARHRWAEAFHAAQTFHAIQPGADSRRLLAVCCLLSGDFREALWWFAHET